MFQTSTVAPAAAPDTKALRGVGVACLLLALPALVLSWRFLSESDYTRTALAGQLLDTLLSLVAIALGTLWVFTLVRIVAKRPIGTPLWLLVVPRRHSRRCSS